MSTRIRVRFDLHREHADWARALQKHLRDNEGLHMELDEICKRQFVNWMFSNSKQAEAASGQHTEATQGEAVTGSDPAEVQTTTDSNALLPTEEARPDQQA